MIIPIVRLASENLTRKEVMTSISGWAKRKTMHTVSIFRRKNGSFKKYSPSVIVLSYIVCSFPFSMRSQFSHHIQIQFRQALSNACRRRRPFADIY